MLTKKIINTQETLFSHKGSEFFVWKASNRVTWQRNVAISQVVAQDKTILFKIDSPKKLGMEPFSIWNQIRRLKRQPNRNKDSWNLLLFYKSLCTAYS